MDLSVIVIVSPLTLEINLRRCLDSIVNQDFDDYEIVMVYEDDSEDILNICENASKEIDNCRLVQNEGPGYAKGRHEAVNIARGGYLFFIYSKDHINDSGMLRRLMDRTKLDSADVVYFYERDDANITPDKSNLLFDREFYLKPDMLLRYSASRDYMDLSSLLMKSVFLQKNIVLGNDDYYDFYATNIMPFYIDSLAVLELPPEAYWRERQLPIDAPEIYISNLYKLWRFVHDTDEDSIFGNIPEIKRLEIKNKLLLKYEKSLADEYAEYQRKIYTAMMQLEVAGHKKYAVYISRESINDSYAIAAILDGISPEVFFLRQGDKDDLKNRASRVTMSFKQLERLYNRDEYRIVLPGEGFFSVCKELFGRKIIQSFEEIMPFGGNSQLELEYAMAFKCMIS